MCLLLNNLANRKLAEICFRSVWIGYKTYRACHAFDYNDYAVETNLNGNIGQNNTPIVLMQYSLIDYRPAIELIYQNLAP